MNDGDLEKRLNEVLEKLQSKDNEAIIIFTKSEAEALQQVAYWWIAARGAGRLGGALGSFIKYMALFLGAWLALKAGVLDWITSHLGGGK